MKRVAWAALIVAATVTPAAAQKTVMVDGKKFICTESQGRVTCRSTGANVMHSTSLADAIGELADKMRAARAREAVIAPPLPPAVGGVVKIVSDTPGGIAPAPPPCGGGRYHIVRAEYAILADKYEAVLRIDTVTGQTWRFSVTGWTVVDEAQRP